MRWNSLWNKSGKPNWYEYKFKFNYSSESKMVFAGKSIKLWATVTSCMRSQPSVGGFWFSTLFFMTDFPQRPFAITKQWLTGLWAYEAEALALSSWMRRILFLLSFSSSLDIFVKGKPDLNTSLPVRQTASIFKQPVTKVTNHPNNKVKTDPQKAVDQPRQVNKLLLWQ